MLTCCLQRSWDCMCMQASLLRALDDDMAVHLLPPLHLAPGGSSAYLPSPSSGAAAEVPPPAGTGAQSHRDLPASSAAEPMLLPDQVLAPGAAAEQGDANGAGGAQTDAGGGTGADHVPNPALVELARLAACGRLERTAEMRSVVADLALARLLPLLAPGASTARPLVLMAIANGLTQRFQVLAVTEPFLRPNGTRGVGAFCWYTRGPLACTFSPDITCMQQEWMAWMRALCATCCRALTPGIWSACSALMVETDSIESAAIADLIEIWPKYVGSNLPECMPLLGCPC